MPHRDFEDVIAPRDFATLARRWRAAGVQGIGRCCGLSPDHIEAIPSPGRH